MDGRSFGLVQVGRGLNQVGYIVSRLGAACNYILQSFVLLGTELLQDIGKQVSDAFGFWLTGYDECIILN